MPRAKLEGAESWFLGSSAVDFLTLSESDDYLFNQSHLPLYVRSDPYTIIHKAENRIARIPRSKGTKASSQGQGEEESTYSALHVSSPT